MRLAIVLFSISCMGQLSGNGAGGSGGDSATSGGTGGTGGTTGTSGGTTGGGPSDDPPAPLPSYAMNRLTHVQYANTVANLFPGVSFPDFGFPAENVIDGFSNAASGQTPSPALISAYHQAAITITGLIQPNLAAILGCTPTTRADEDACAQSFITRFGKRAWRRPLSSDEATRLLQFYQAGRADDDFQTAMLSTIRLFLETPAFLYRIEYGTGSAMERPLDSYELATRLSYFLWDNMPDDALFAAADAGTLTDTTQLAAQAQRLLADPKAHQAVARFNHQWLRLEKLEQMAKDPTLFPQFNATLAEELRDSTTQFLEYAFWTEGSLAGLLSDSHVYINDDLAPLYGLAKPGSMTLTLAAADPTQRAGILTQAGLMAGFAHGTEDSPVLRGVLVLDRLLCVPPPPPPAGVNTTLPSSDPNMPRTNRQILSQSHAVGSCASCHEQIDGVGFLFDNYDALGQWRTQDNGLPVDASGTVTGTNDMDGDYPNAVALANQLAQSKQVAGCVAFKWLRYGLGLDETQSSTTNARDLAKSFVAGGGKLQDLLVQIVTSPAFRTLVVAN